MIDVGRICAVSFSDAVGAFVVGMLIGCAFTVLARIAFGKNGSDHPQ